MTREHLLNAIQKELEKDPSIEIYIGRNDRTKIPGSPTIHYTDDHDQGPYFYAQKHGFSLLFPHAKPIGVTTSAVPNGIFWSDEEEAMRSLTEQTH